MKLLASYREWVRARPDSEHSQALLRTLIVWLLLINTAWVAGSEAEVGARLWAVNLFSALFSILLFARILRRPHASPRRRVLGAVHDNLAITVWLHASGPAGALALFVYSFVTVGNGFRFGVSYLAWSGLLGAAGIGTLFFAAPGWTPFATIGAGIFTSHIVVTAYTGILLRHLRQTQGEMERMATSDALTGLPNRRCFMDRLSHVVAARGCRQVACLYLDLDGFKAVNDGCGHKAGDELLGKVAAGLVGCVRASDTVARLGGDEFSVVLDDLSDAEVAKGVADRIIRVVEGITSADGQPVRVSVSIGISFLPATDLGRPLRSEELLKAADAAMYVAKKSGKGRYEFVDLGAAPRGVAA